MFDSEHYVPILKWKAAEHQALEKLDEKKKKYISPLFQLLLPDPSQAKKGQIEKTPEEQYEESVAKFRAKIPQIPLEILKYWGKTPAFIDLNLLIDKSLQQEGFAGILNGGKSLGIFLVPVISLNSDKVILTTVTSQAKKLGLGLCLRLFRSDFSSPGLLTENIKNFLTEYDLSKKEIDLLVDFQITDGRCLKLDGVIKEIPEISKWRTFIFASGAFPIDLTACKVGLNYLPRTDLKSWVSQISIQKLQRKPAFADYTIQHPIYNPQSRHFTPSASIRYTLKDNWLIMRGEQGKTEQYLANAQLLSKLPEFFGENFSFGDAYILEKGKNLKTKKTGNAKNWLAAGINHHLTCTADQIASLSGHTNAP